MNTDLIGGGKDVSLVLEAHLEEGRIGRGHDGMVQERIVDSDIIFGAVASSAFQKLEPVLSYVLGTVGIIRFV